MGIGRQVKLLVDKSRQDFYSGEETRRIPISIFYPTKQEGSSLYEDLYAPKEELLVKIYGEGKDERVKHLKSLTTSFLNNATPDLSKARPVIVFSHGLEADRDFYLFLIEPLVEAGYVVVTTGHLYDTDLTLLPDGEEVLQKEGLLAESSYEQRTAQIEARGHDMWFVVDYLDRLNKEDSFAGLLDLNLVGLAGHSLGGMTVLKTLPHPLVKAGVLLDAALQYIDVEEDLKQGVSVDKPLLNFRRDSTGYGHRIRYRIEKSKGRSGEKFKEIILREHEQALNEEVDVRQLYQYVNGRFKNFIYMDKTVHMTFCDWFRLVPDKYYPTLIPIEEAHTLIAEVVCAFFQENLLKEGTPYTDLIHDEDSQGIHLEPIGMY
ncbi:MAG: hypothetical protein GX833_04860 [Clostridium sp.]|nr:hypothetical protein [Clostridium sp.]